MAQSSHKQPLVKAYWYINSLKRVVTKISKPLMYTDIDLGWAVCHQGPGDDLLVSKVQSRSD